MADGTRRRSSPATKGLTDDERRYIFVVRVVCTGAIMLSIVALVFATITQDILHLRGSEALVATLLGGLLLLLQVDGAALVKRLKPDDTNPGAEPDAE